MIKRLIQLGVLFLMGLCAGAASAQFVTLSGSLTSSNGMPARNYNISFTPSQFGFVAGTSVIINTSTACATSVDGSVVGVPNPLVSPPVSVSFTGTLPAANYFVKFAFYDAAGNVTLVSPETQIQLTATGRVIVASPVAGMPSGAAGMKVYLSTSSGTETLQGQTTGSAAFIQSTPLTSGAAVPTTNTTLCKQIANDVIWPSGTGYTVSMTDPSGNTIPGYPMQWQLMGAGTTINLSSGLPYYHGTVYFPTPILASPLNHATQSISGNLDMGGFSILNANFGGTVTTYGQLLTAIGACGSENCGIVIGANIAIPSNLSIPANIALGFQDGQLLPAAGVTLTIAGMVNAGSVQIFAGAGTVTGLSVDKPEWWGGSTPLISTAVNGLASTGGKILLADQSKVVYRSGYDFLTTLVMSKNNVEIAGAGVCTPLDDLSTCTGGSRIIGEFDSSASFLHYHDFGVDDGCNAVSAIYSGTPSNGLVFANPGQALTFREKTVNLERVSGLVCGASAAFHAALLENVDDLHASSVIAYGGTHGVVIKTLNSEVVGVVSKHHSSECFYIKSDFYAPAGASSLHGLVASDCQDGLLVQGFDADLKGFTANGINCDSLVNTCLFVTGAIGGGGFVTNGIVLSDITSYAGNALFSDPTVSDLQVSNLTQISPSGSLAINSANTVLHGCQILNVPVSIPAIIITASTSNAVISDCIISGTGSFGSPLSAISIGATNTVLSNIRLSGAWTGFCMVNVGTGSILSSNFLLTGSCALGTNNGNNFILNGNFQTTLVTNGTSTPNVIAIPGTVAPLGCRFEPGNTAAAGDAANDFIDTIVVHSLTFHHSSTNAMAFRILCSY